MSYWSYKSSKSKSLHNKATDLYDIFDPYDFSLNGRKNNELKVVYRFAFTFVRKFILFPWLYYSIISFCCCIRPGSILLHCGIPKPEAG